MNHNFNVIRFELINSSEKMKKKSLPISEKESEKFSQRIELFLNFKLKIILSDKFWIKKFKREDSRLG